MVALSGNSKPIFQKIELKIKSMSSRPKLRKQILTNVIRFEHDCQETMINQIIHKCQVAADSSGCG